MKLRGKARGKVLAARGRARAREREFDEMKAARVLDVRLFRNRAHELESLARKLEAESRLLRVTKDVTKKWKSSSRCRVSRMMTEKFTMSLFRNTFTMRLQILTKMFVEFFLSGLVRKLKSGITRLISLRNLMNMLWQYPAVVTST